MHPSFTRPARGPIPSRSRLLTALVALLAAGALVGCKKAPEKKGGSEAEATSMGAMDTMDAMDPGARPEARREPPRPAPPADPDLAKKLAERFGKDNAKAFEGVIARLKGAEKAITGLGEKGKSLYPMLLASAQALLEIPKTLADGRLGEVPPLVVNGYVMALVAVKLVAAEIAATGKRAAAAAQGLRVNEARKLAAHAKRLAVPAKVAGELLKIYGLALEEVMTSKSGAVRASAFLAAAGAAAKADAVAKKVILETLKRFLAAEKDGGVKDKMTAALKGLP